MGKVANAIARASEQQRAGFNDVLGIVGEGNRQKLMEAELFNRQQAGIAEAEYRKQELEQRGEYYDDIVEQQNAQLEESKRVHTADIEHNKIMGAAATKQAETAALKEQHDYELHKADIETKIAKMPEIKDTIANSIGQYETYNKWITDRYSAKDPALGTVVTPGITPQNYSARLKTYTSDLLYGGDKNTVHAQLKKESQIVYGGLADIQYRMSLKEPTQVVRNGQTRTILPLYKMSREDLVKVLDATEAQIPENSPNREVWKTIGIDTLTQWKSMQGIFMGREARKSAVNNAVTAEPIFSRKNRISNAAGE